MDSPLSSAHPALTSDLDHGNSGQTTQDKLQKYDIAYLTPQCQVVEFSRTTRRHPTFENAFSALGHNAIVQTAQGQMSAEDVMPGDVIRMADGTFETLLWRGSILIGTGQGATPCMTRITGDAFGYNRPTPDLVLGPAARLLHRASGIRKLTGCDAAFIPAADFIDGNNVIALQPVAPVRTYQLGFATQRSLSVNGLQIETLHPGTAFTLGLRGEILTEYLSLFPHKRRLEDFGLMDHPRLRLRDLELLG